METPQLLLLLLLGLRTYTSCLKLPTYIKPCSRNDPNINACAKEHAIFAIPHFINGDPKYKVPILDPLQIEELSISRGSSNIGLSFTATNLTVTGLKLVQVKDIRIDLETMHFSADFFFPIAEVQCHYNVSGQVLILPISGSGDGVLDFKDVDFHIDFDCDKVRRTANGKEYLIPKKFAFKMEPHGMTIQLENLFNGNKFLGDNMNTFLNENWKELVREFSPIIGEALSEIAKTVVTNIIEVVPYEESFPERV